MELRNYQARAVRELYNYLRTRSGNPCVVIPTGGGKTPVIATICKDAVQQWNGRVLIVAHVKELLEQSVEKLQAVCPLVPVGVYSAGLGSRDTMHPVIVGGIQSIYDKASQLGRFDLMLIDECFTGDTIISTPMGGKRIDNMRCGDTVYCASGIGVVERTSCRPANELYKLEFSDGTSIACTGNHPIFTDSGWTKASSMAIGSFVYDIEAVCFLWQSVLTSALGVGKRTDASSSGKILEQASMLLSILCKEIQEPDEQSSIPSKNEGTFKRNKTQAYKAWRERAIASLASASTLARIRGRMGIGGSDSDRTQSMGRIGIPDMLQNRHSEPCEKNRNRTRREKPRNNRTKETRCEENGFPGRARLVNISHSKSESPRPVYNLQVSGHPSYFANGKLAHNCHLISENSEGRYRSLISDLIEINPDMRIVGLTATPYRVSTGMICSKDGILNDICYSISVSELIARGFLCPLTCKAAKAEVDTTHLKIVRGEFDEKIAGDTFGVPSVVNEAVEEIVAKTKERKSVLIFCQTVAHAESVASALRWRGEVVQEIYGDTPADERRKHIADFRAGTLKYLVNVNVLTTGFDAPNVDCVCLLRATVSPGLYYQMIGRGFRIFPSKKNALVLDFGQNVKRHGPLDDIKPKAKGKEQESAGGKACPRCSEVVSSAAKVCKDCGYEWTTEEREITHDGQASEDDPTGKPTITERTVTKVTYQVHKKKGASDDHPKTLRVNYQLENPVEFVSEWICVEHKGFARAKAERWWASRAQGECPVSAEDAFDHSQTGDIRSPYKIKIKMTPGERFPEIVGYSFRDAGEEDLTEALEHNGIDLDEIPF